MAVTVHVRGPCFLLLLLLPCCVLAVGSNRGPDYRYRPYGLGPYSSRRYGRYRPGYGGYEGYGGYGGYEGYVPYVYRRQDKDCQSLQARMVYLLGELQDNSCQSYCGSEGGECRPVSDSCTEAVGLCERGKKCCSPPTTTTTTQSMTTGGGLQCNFGSFHCVEGEECEDLQFGSVQAGLGGCTGSQVCCNAACPILQPPPPGAPPGTRFAQCSPSGQCDPAGDYPTLETGYVCLGSTTQVCCLARVN